MPEAARRRGAAGEPAGAAADEATEVEVADTDWRPAAGLEALRRRAAAGFDLVVLAAGAASLDEVIGAPTGHA